MKRGGRLKRTTALMRGEGLSRDTPLARGEKQLRRVARRRRRPEQTAAEWKLEQIAAEAWRVAVVGRSPCVMCKHFPVSGEIRAAHRPDLMWRQAHHVVAKRHLKRHGLAGRLWDSDNGLCLCAYHHERHENTAQRVPLELLPYRALRFAHEVGLSWILDREYAR